MSTLNTTTYVRKLVKIVYQKEKQIQSLKRALKNRHQRHASPLNTQQIDPQLKTELESTSQTLRGVNQQLLAMESRMIELEFGLEDEITKNAKLEEEIAVLRRKEIQSGKAIGAKDKQIEEYQRKIVKLIQKNQAYNRKQLEIAITNKKISEQLTALKQQELKKRYEIVRCQKQMNNYRGELKKLQNQSQTRKNQLDSKIEECQQLYQQLKNTLNICEKQLLQINQLKQSISTLANENSSLKTQLQNAQDSLKMKESQCQLVSETLKDYQEFAFQISHFIQSSHLKHFCKGSLRSSKKLIRQADNRKAKFQTTFHMMNQLQTWMESTSQKLQKMIHQQELPCQTLQNLSLIAQSFEEKLQLCNLTERIEKDKIQMDKQQQQLLDNLQKQCQKSYQRERSKFVELDEVKQILKITKDVNRQLMGQINKKQYIISQCRKLYGQIIGNKSNPQYKNLKTLLNTKF